MATPVAPKIVVSFDVDGTLIRSVGGNANKVHKDAFCHGFKQVFGLDTNIDVIKHHGSTDPLIIIKVLEHHGIAREQALARLSEVQEAMVGYFLEHSESASSGLEVLPGVEELLRRLQDCGTAATCLVTGNLEPIGWSKMRSLGLEELFTRPLFGGFGTDHCSGNFDESWRDRAEFIRIATAKLLKEAEDGTDAREGDWRRFHVGDTPNDVLAAVNAGVTAIAVATGIFTKEELALVAPGKDVIVLDGLADVEAFMKLVGL